MTSTATTGGAGASSHGGTGFPAARLNHLANSTSPYLLQHKEDPVDWYEFSDEAFAKARRENKLVFLSIGYSSCHWCHQMRYDSFSQPEVADALNRSFVSIKVDREERPDVDATYMQFVMALNGSGGWPLSAFLTPDAKPLFGGTFFPRRQFLGILDKLATMWTEERHSCLASADGIAAQLSSQLGPRSGSKLDQLPSDRLGIKAAEHWLKRFDAENGGFGDAPKFPTVSNTHHLLHRVVALAGNGGPSDEWKTVEVRELADRALYASLFTLLKISRGGITDQLGGGIARYSVDDEWRVPHFEKMLYDQAQLLTVFCEAIQLARQSGDATLRGMVPELEGTARGIVGYLKTDLSNEAGGLFSAEDADSLPTSASATKKEGAFYVWELDEVETLLGRDSDEARLVVAHYGMRRDGNVPAESDPHGELTGQNMLHAVGPVADTARTVGLDVERAQRTLAAAKAKMLERRNAGRPRPHRDDKIIAAWNGLALSGLCKAAEVLPAGPGGSAEAREMALAAARFLIEHLYSAEQNRLRRSWRDGRVGPWGFSSDYAFVTQGLLDLYELEGDPEHLELAVRLQQRLDTGFWDERVGGYFISEDASGASSRAADVVGQGEGDRDGDGDGDRTGEGDGSALLTRQKDEQDGAEPSATSVAAHNLLRLGWTLDRVPTTAATALPWEERRDAVIKAGGVVLERAAFALGTLTTALLGVHDGGQQILLAGPGLSASSRSGPGAEVQATTTSKTEAEQRERGKAAAMRDAVRRRFGPYRSVVQVDLDRVAEPRYQWLAQHNAAVASLLQRSTAGEAEAHVCENFACGMPIRDVDGFVKRLEG